MDEATIRGPQCTVWHGNDGAEKMCCSKKKQRSSQWLGMKNIGWFKNIYDPNINVSESLWLY